MVWSLDEFVRNLAASGLMSAAEIAAAQKGFPPGQPPDAEQFAKDLVRLGRLTLY